VLLNLMLYRMLFLTNVFFILTEDMEVLEITRDAMMKSKPKSARSTKILHSTPKSQVAPKAFASVSYAKKSLPPTVGNTSNSGFF